MANYQRDDIILVENPDNQDRAFEATVISSLVLSPEDVRYTVRDEDERLWHIRESAVIELLGGPSLEEEDAVDWDGLQPDEGPLFEEVQPTTPVIIGTQRALNVTDEDGQLLQREVLLQREAERWATEALGGERIRRVDPDQAPRPKTVREGLVGYNSSAIQWTFDAELTPHPEVPPTPIVNLATEDVLREGRQLMDGNRVSISSMDYRPQMGESRRLCFFRLGGNVATPVLENGEYIFRDEQGTEWINQHQSNFVWGMQARINDEHHQRWTTRQAYDHEHRIAPDRPAFNLPQKGRKSKKKLRRKHPIPEIKDEKYYASKEFIA